MLTINSQCEGLRRDRVLSATGRAGDEGLVGNTGSMEVVVSLIMGTLQTSGARKAVRNPACPPSTTLICTRYI